MNAIKSGTIPTVSVERHALETLLVMAADNCADHKEMDRSLDLMELFHKVQRGEVTELHAADIPPDPLEAP